MGEAHTVIILYGGSLMSVRRLFLDNGKCVYYCRVGEEFNKDLGQCVSLSANNQCSPTAGNPVAIGNGEKIQAEQPDIQNGGSFPLVFSHTYRSHAAGEAEAQLTNVYSQYAKSKTERGVFCRLDTNISAR